MNFDSIKEYENLKEQWYEYNGQRIENESKLRQSYQERLTACYLEAQKEFKDYFVKKGFTINESRIFIIVSYNEYKVQMCLGEPTTQEKFEFEIIIVKPHRNVFRVVIMPEDKLYYPPLNILRDMPESKEQFKMDISKMADEVFNLIDLQKKIKENPFVFSFYRADNSKPDYIKIKKYYFFIELVNVLLKE